MYGLATNDGKKLNLLDSLLKMILIGSLLCNSTPSINAELNSVDEAVHLLPGENDGVTLLVIPKAQDSSLPISPVSHTIQGDGQFTARTSIGPLLANKHVPGLDQIGSSCLIVMVSYTIHDL